MVVLGVCPLWVVQMRMQMHAESTCVQMKMEPLLHFIFSRQRGCACATMCADTTPLIISVPGPLPVLTHRGYKSTLTLADVDPSSAIIIVSFFYAPAVMLERGPNQLGCRVRSCCSVCVFVFSSRLGPCVDF